MKYPQLHPSLLAAGLCGFLPLSAPAEPSAVKPEVTTETKIPFQNRVALPPQKESPSAVTGGNSAGPKAISGQSSSSSSARSSSSTISVNGRTITTTRSSGSDGKEKITVTTQERSGKPKIETFTPAEYQQKYGPEKKAPPPAKPAAAAPATANKSNSQRATE